MSSLARKPIWSEAPNRPHLEMVQSFRETVPGLLSRIEVLRHASPKLLNAASELQRRALNLTGVSPYHRKQFKRVEQLLARYECAQRLADIVLDLKPGEVKVMWVKSMAYVVEISMLPPRAASRRLNRGGVIALIACDDKIYSDADGVNGRMFNAIYGGVSEEIMPESMPWSKPLMNVCNHILANGGLVTDLRTVK